MTSLEELRAELRAFVAARDWQQFHDPKNLAMLVASEAGELVAEYRWVRGEDSDAHSREAAARERIVAEVADVGIGLVLLCERIGVDLVEAMRAKVVKNGEKYPAEVVRGKAEKP
jgi:NTP pyrophosphatase (non-canonical NTP hydrolase)